MKILKIYLLVLLTMQLSFTSCSKDEIYDDTLLKEEIDSLAERISKLEQMCKQMNTNVSSLQSIVDALQNNDYITSITPILLDKKEIGYTINFHRGKPITIYHGKDGKDGTNGENFQIGIKKYIDNIYYWTIDGEWLLDSNSQKIKAEGVDGITPKLKIVDDYWYVSYDNEQNWIKLGLAKDSVADSFFKDVVVKDDRVVFTLNDANSTEFEILLYNELSLLLGTWRGTNDYDGSSYTITFNRDYTYLKIGSDYKYEGWFEFYPDRHMFIVYYKDKTDNIIYTIVDITKDILILNNNGWSNVDKYERVK